METTICKHCKKPLTKKAKFVGLTAICPHCNKPSEELWNNTS